jgi:hypothetical protein
MIARNPKLLCREAKPYYYDFLCDESRGLIPEFIVNHIEQCQHCLQVINQLEAMLSQTEGLESKQGQVSSAIATMLKLHFAYIGKPVTCNIAKPFLPTLLDPTLGIRIPTPIVTHVCDCQQCSEDLDIIRTLNLSRKQLCRLSQLFAEKSAGSNIGCSKAQNAVPSVASMILSETDSEVLKHLCICPVCRRFLYKERQKLCDSLPRHALPSQFSCEPASASDFFDYVVPYGIDPANDQYAKFRKSFISHITNCPNCLAKIQQLHDTIYHIVERAESEVVTVYHIDETAKAGTAGESEGVYAGFPVRVDVMRPEEVKAKTPDPIIDLGSALKQKLSTTNLKSLVRIGIAAAAVIFIVVALLLNIPTARAVTLSQIHKALEKVKNVHISSFVPDKTEPIQEKWVSRTLNIYMSKTGKQLVLWDIPNHARRSKQSDASSVETSPLSTEMITKIEGTIVSFWGLVPFADLSVVPGNAEWNRITDRSLEAIAKGIEVYDLTWTERANDGSTVFKKWRFFVDPKTNLPERTEFYQKLPADDEYIFISAMEVEYLSDSKMQEVIKEVFF